MSVSEPLTCNSDDAASPESSGEELASDTLDQLHRMAAHLMRAERQGHTLTPTALVNEAVCRILRTSGGNLSPGETLALSTVVMRRVLIDHARARNARPDRVRRVEADAVQPSETRETPPDAQAELSDVATVVQAMAKVSPRAAKALQLRYWEHQTVNEAAATLKISPALLKAEVQWAKQFIRERLTTE